MTITQLHNMLQGAYTWIIDYVYGIYIYIYCPDAIKPLREFM